MNRMSQNILNRPPLGYLVVFWLLKTAEILLLLPWFVLSGLAIMAFDAPGSEKEILNWIGVLFIWSYPVWLWISIPVARKRFTARRYKSAISWLLIPLAHASILGFYFLVLPIIQSHPHAQPIIPADRQKAALFSVR